jgi:hypothetical protein
MAVFSVPGLTPAAVETYRSTRIYLYNTDSLPKDEPSPS